MELEERIHGLLRAGDLRAAATSAVAGYGPEILGFLVTLLRNESDASEAFSQACEDLWRALARFEGRSSVRTWFYALARHAAARLRRSPHRRARRRLPLDEVGEMADLVRTATLPHLRTDAKQRLASIRDSLAESDRALLVLRLDRQMSWSDIARVLSRADASCEELARAGARLRKRFQLLKEQIRQRARKAGLLGEAEP